MSGPKFHETRMGAKFFEHTLPALGTMLGRLEQAIGEATTAMHRLAEALEESNLEQALDLPCSECGEEEAIVALPWDREQKVCAECWAELSDGVPIADADRIHKIPSAPE